MFSLLFCLFFLMCFSQFSIQRFFDVSVMFFLGLLSFFLLVFKKPSAARTAWEFQMWIC